MARQVGFARVKCKSSCAWQKVPDGRVPIGAVKRPPFIVESHIFDVFRRHAEGGSETVVIDLLGICLHTLEESVVPSLDVIAPTSRRPFICCKLPYPLG